MQKFISTSSHADSSGSELNYRCVYSCAYLLYRKCYWSYRWFSWGVVLSIHFWRATGKVCMQCSCVQNAGKQVIHSAPRLMTSESYKCIKCFYQGERSTVRLPLDHAATLQKWLTLPLWKPSTSISVRWGSVIRCDILGSCYLVLYLLKFS